MARASKPPISSLFKIESAIINVISTNTKGKTYPNNSAVNPCDSLKIMVTC
jgi:hypothetical protein